MLIAEINTYIQSNPYIRNDRFFEPRWAIWSHGYLVHVEGDFYQQNDVASLRKTWHAMIEGAAIQQGKIRNVHQPVSAFLAELEGYDAESTWKAGTFIPSLLEKKALQPGHPYHRC